MRSYGSRSLFRNTLSLPLGLSFTRYLPENEFLQLPTDGKEQVLLAVAVLDPASLGAVEGLKPVSASDLERNSPPLRFPRLFNSAVPALFTSALLRKAGSRAMSGSTRTAF